MSATTIKDIARAVNVSAATVSNALNGKGGVGEKTRQRIMDTARRMGYQPNIFAKKLVSQKSYTIGLIVSSISDPFYPELARGVQDQAGKVGYCMMLLNTNHDKEVERNGIETLHSRGVDGIILATVLRDDPSIVLLRQLNMPFVLVNRHLLDPGSAGCIDSVVLDNYDGGYQSARHLLRIGHRRIVVIAGDLEASTAILRTKGTRDAMEAHGVAEGQYEVIDCGYKTERAYEAAKKILAGKREDWPTAFLCQGDNMALGVREAVCEKGVRIPEEMAIVGFDNIDFSSVSGVELTTVCHRQYEMGQKGAALLIGKISDETQDEHCNTIVLKADLVIRKSCGYHLKGYTR